MAIWDNRSTQHYAVMDYAPCHRKMERAGIVGDKPYGVGEKLTRAQETQEAALAV